jgi:hypothetical protein
MFSFETELPITTGNVHINKILWRVREAIVVTEKQ